MIKYYVSVYVNNNWLFIDVVYASNSNEAIAKAKKHNHCTQIINGKRSLIK